MRRLALDMLRAALAVAMTATAMFADSVVLQDGSTQAIDDSALANVGDATWPGWIALRRTLTVREDDVATSMLGLDDGQRVGGGFNVVQDALWWRSRAVGAMHVDLERIAWIGPPALALQRAPTRDQVALVNGDRVEGFVNAVNADRGVEVETGTGTASPVRTWYDIGKVASIQLAPRPRPATGWRFWLRDGSIVDMDGWKREGSRVVLQGLHLPGIAPRVMIAWDEVLGIGRSGATIVPLASLDWKADDGADNPRLAPAQARIAASVSTIDLHAIDLHGPGTFMVRVPQGRWMLDLSIGVPPVLAGRVGCTVQVLAGDRELARMRIDAKSRPTTVHAPIDGGDLRVVISEPAHGAFGASARLDGAMLVPVTPDAAAATPAPSSAPASAAGSKGPG